MSLEPAARVSSIGVLSVPGFFISEIVAVGKGKYSDEGKLIPIEVKAGDRILFGKYSGSEFKHEGEDLLILREDDILGIIE